MKRAAVFDRVAPLDDPGRPLVGGFAGSRFVAAFRSGDASSMLAVWPGPDGEPEAITGIDASVVAVDVSCDGARVAIAAVTVEHDGGATPAPVQLLVVELATREGHRFVRPEMRFSFAEDARPRVLVSEDGRFVAVSPLVSAGAPTACTYVVDAIEKKRVGVLAGRAVQWWDGALCLQDDRGEPIAPWSGALHARAPDGGYTLRTEGSDVTVLEDGAAARPLPAALGACAGWIGPHHLLCAAGVFDVRAWEERELVSGRRDRAALRGATLVALAADGRRAVLRGEGGAHFWAIAEVDSPR